MQDAGITARREGREHHGLKLGLPLSAARLRDLSILVGGASGSLARVGLLEAFPPREGAWPWATFIANLAGALLLAWLVTRLAERIAPTRYWRLLLGTGVAGALTTFSTFQIEILELAKDGYAGLAVAYLMTSLALGMVIAVGGTMLARWGRYR